MVLDLDKIAERLKREDFKECKEEFKTKLAGVVHFDTGINCNEFRSRKIRKSENLVHVVPYCIAKTVKPECIDCGILNPNRRNRSNKGETD